jgi:tetratricopeptide (TPR) repeat protein
MRPRPNRSLAQVALVMILVTAAVLAVAGWVLREHFRLRRSPGTPAQTRNATGYMGSRRCQPCHAEFYGLWATSHHGLAMQPFTKALAKKELPSQQGAITIGARSYRADTAAARVIEEGPEGRKTYAIEWVMGGKNVYYLLTPLAHGRLQVLPVAFDLGTRAWFDTAASGVRHLREGGDAPLDWTERAFTFNTACFACHVSQVANNYDLAKDAYRTTWSEAGINCESCHGPAGQHVRLFESLPAGQKPADPAIIVTKSYTAEQMNDLCAGCHAKGGSLTNSFRPGDRYFDHFDLVTLEHPDYYPDGRDLGENYTFTSWLMSPCLASGRLDCNKCHTPSGRMRQKGEHVNEACLPCHADKVAAAAEHSHHPAGSPGSRCFDCHMPKTTFARMARSDHSMRPPAPAASLAYGSPNACNQCHADRDARWADAQVRRWYASDYQRPVLEQAALIEAARKHDWRRLPAMLARLSSPEAGAVEKTSLLRLLEACDDSRKQPAVRARLADPSPLVRAATAASLAADRSPEATAALVAATGDSLRLVRIRAAEALAGRPLDDLADAARSRVTRAEAELEASLAARPDDWARHYNLGILLSQRGELERAVAAYETAARLEPRTILPLVNASLAFSALGRNDEAEARLRRALAIDPKSAAARLNLGLLLAETGRPGEAERELRSAFELDGTLAQAAHTLCVLVSPEKPEEGLAFCRRAVELAPQETSYAYSLAFFQRERAPQEALATLGRLVAREPSNADAHLLISSIHEARGDRTGAMAALRRGLAAPGLAPTDRARLETQLAALTGRGR